MDLTDINQLPQNWRLIPLKYLGLTENSGVWGEEDYFDSSEEVKISTTRNILKDGTFDEKGMNTRYITKKEKKKYLCQSGDIVIVKSSGSGDNIVSGKCGIVSKNHNFCFGNFLMIFRPDISVLDPKFSFYFLNSHVTKQRILRMVSSTTIANLKVDEYISSLMPVPPLEEQIQISNYLTKKTSHIDSLIEKYQKKISLLIEQRSSVIFDCITKGLNKRVTTKNIDVDWFESIPSHWEVKKIKYLFKIKKIISGELGHKIISITQRGAKIKDIETGEGQLSMDYSKYQFVKTGDFLMNHMDLLTGYVDISPFDGVTSPDYRVFERIDVNSCSEYYLYLFQYCYKLKVFYKYGKGSSHLGRWRFTTIEFENFCFPVPPLDEQRTISKYLDHKTKNINTLIEKITKKIKILNEFRKTLVSSVVTGKITIRD